MDQNYYISAPKVIYSWTNIYKGSCESIIKIVYV